jgi:hypothetical protein
MFKKLLTAALICGLSISCAMQAQANEVMTYGIGRNNCVHWLQDEYHKSEGQIYILGYWSGLNAMSTTNRFVGRQSDSQAIWAEVELYCKNHPSERFMNAIIETYRMFAEKGL